MEWRERERRSGADGDGGSSGGRIVVPIVNNPGDGAVYGVGVVRSVVVGDGFESCFVVGKDVGTGEG